MNGNRIEFKKTNIDEFIKAHDHIGYCEAIIYTDGDITYACPSHTECLLSIYCAENNMTRDEVYDSIPVSDDPMITLLRRTKCISVWDELGFLGIPNDAQRVSLKKLEEAKLINNLEIKPRW